MISISYKAKLFLLYLFSVLLATLLVYKLLETFHETSAQSVSQKHFKNKLFERETYFHDFLNPYFTTIRSIQKDPKLIQYLSGAKNKKEVQEYFLSLKKALPCITQIKFIDNTKKENIKIDGSPMRLPNPISKILQDDKLQDKANRDYVKQFFKLSHDQVGISKINLKQEYGKVTTPKQPNIRLGMLALDNENKTQGIIVINICLRTLFKLLNNTTLYYVHLIDKDGNFINHHDPKYGLLGSNMNYSVYDEFPSDAEAILNNDEFFNEFFHVKKIENFLNSQNLKMILELKFQEEFKQRELTQRNFTIIAIIVALIFIPLIIYLSKLPDKLKKKLDNKQEIENKNIFINTLLKSIPIPMFYKNIDGMYFDINEEFTRLFGYEYEQIVGKSVYEVTDKKHADIYKKYDDELIFQKNPQTQVYQSVVKNIKTGKLYNVIFHKNLFFDVNKKPIGIIGAAIDVTQITQIKKELEELNKNLELRVQKEVKKNLKQELQLFESSKLAAMGEMMNNIIHQWNQPLTIISLKASYIETLARKEEFLEHKYIQEEMDYIITAINRLSDVTKTFGEFLKEKKEEKEIDLQEVLEKSLVISGTVLKDKGFELINKIDHKEKIILKTIPNELIEVVINIINNAIDVLEEKEISNGWVQIKTIKKKNHALIMIEDNGGGIPNDVLPFIFDEYFTTKDADKGTGIGLYMSKKIIKSSLRGNLKVKNTQFGAKFIIELPMSL